MSSDDILEPIKSKVWLGFEIYSIPLEVLTDPPLIGGVKDKVKFGFLDDEFEIYVVKALPSTVTAVVYKAERGPNEEVDDGYALRFYFTIIGFDEGPQSAIMKPDGQRSNPPVAFNVTENILRKVNTTHHLFELFVVVEMLEFKSLPKAHQQKKNVDALMTFLKSRLKRAEVKHLSYILKSPGLKNTFTGRLPYVYMSSILYIVAAMARNYAGIAQYLKARHNGNSDTPTLDVGKIIKYIGLVPEEGPLTPDEAIEQYLIANKLGLDCYKTIASDYLLNILDTDNNALDILEASLMVHDEELFEKAVLSFLHRFHEITRSPRFRYFTQQKGIMTRLIIHSARIWVSNNDVYIPGWPPTTEL